MMGLGKTKLCTKFEVPGFIYGSQMSVHFHKPKYGSRFFLQQDTVHLSPLPYSASQMMNSCAAALYNLTSTS